MFLRKIWTHRHSVFFSWLFSYASIIMVPLAISVFIYIQTERVLENEIQRANSSILKQAQEVMDNYLRTIENLSVEIAFDNQVQGLLHAGPVLSDEQRFNAYKLSQSLKVYGTANSFIDEIYIYFKDVDLVVSANSMAGGKNFYEISGMGQAMSYSEWMDTVNGVHFKQYIPLFVKSPRKVLTQKILYIQSIPIVSPKKSDANLVIVIDEGLFKESVKNIEWLNSGDAFIIDKNNRVLASTGSLSGVASLAYEHFRSNNGLSHEYVSGRKAAVSYIASEINDWKYVSLIPSSLFWEKSNQVRRLTFFSIVLCLLMGSLVAFAFLRKNYKPVNSLVRALADRMGLQFDKQVNEYNFIQEAMSITMDEKEKIQRTLEKQKLGFRTNFLQGLLNGTQHGDVALEDHLSLHGIRFNSEYFAVMLLYIDSFDGLFSDNSKPSISEKLNLAQFILSNVVEELAGRNHQGYTCNIDNIMACTINIKEDLADRAAQELNEIAKEAQSFIKEKYRIYFTVSISDIHKTAAGIPSAYREALQAMEYKMVVGLEEIIHYKKMQHSPGGSYYYSLELEQQLINWIRVGDYDKAKAILEAVFDSNLKQGSLSSRLAKFLMYDIACTMFKAVENSTEYSENQIFSEFDLFEHVLDFKTLDDMKLHLLKTLERICGLIREERFKKDYKSEYIAKIAAHVIENYNDIDLSISTIAAKFDITPDYLSRLFKEKTGQGILDFMNKTRLAEAKRLMADDAVTMKEISNLVGYVSTSTFIRNFKRYEGITPSEFKSLQKA